MAEKYGLRLVGPFGIFKPTGERIEVSSRKSIALIALLAVSPGGVRTRSWLRNMLWGDRSEEQAQASLRRELSNLVILLDRAGAHGIVVREMQRVALNMDVLTVDALSLGVDTSLHPAHFTGDFLEGLDLPGCEEFEDWLRLERSRIEDIAAAARDFEQASPPRMEDVYGGRLPSSDEMLASAAPKLPPKPSLGILPFTHLGGGHGEGWLGHALAEDLSVIISSYPQLFVVSSGSTRLLHDQALTPNEIAARLGIQYIVDGTIARSDNQLRVTVALIDAANSEQKWGDVFFGSIDELSDLKEEIANRVAPQLWTQIDQVERVRGLSLTGPPRGDYETYWRANALLRTWNAMALREALALLDDLTERNPRCPWATSLAGYCYSQAYLFETGSARTSLRRSASQFCQTAMLSGSENVEALGYCAGTLINIGGDIAIADQLVAKALTVLPAFQPSLFWGGWVDIVSGEAERARARFDLALRLNPATGARGPTLCGIGYSYLIEANPETALDHFRKAHEDTPDFPPTVLGLFCAAHALGQDVAFATREAVIQSGAHGIIQVMRREADRAYLAAGL